MSECISTGCGNFKVGDTVVLIKGWSRVAQVNSDSASAHWCEELSRDAEYTVKRIGAYGSLHLEGSYLVFNCNCFRKVTPPSCF